jgi:hypothetical protein
MLEYIGMSSQVSPPLEVVVAAVVAAGLEVAGFEVAGWVVLASLSDDPQATRADTPQDQEYCCE